MPAAPILRLHGATAFNSTAGLYVRRFVRTPAAITFPEAVRNLLLTTPALVELTAVYIGDALDRPAFPFACVNVVGEDLDCLITDFPDYPVWADVQVSVLDTDRARGQRLRDAAYKALAPVSNATGTARLSFVDGADSGGRRPGMKREIKQPSTGRAGEGPRWSFLFDTKLHLTRSWT